MPDLENAMLEILWAMDELSPDVPEDIRPFLRVYDALDPEQVDWARSSPDVSVAFGDVLVSAQEGEITNFPSFDAPSLCVEHPMWNVKLCFNGGESWIVAEGPVDLVVLTSIRDHLRLHSTENTIIRQYGDVITAAMS